MFLIRTVDRGRNLAAILVVLFRFLTSLLNSVHNRLLSPRGVWKILHLVLSCRLHFLLKVLFSLRLLLSKVVSATRCPNEKVKQGYLDVR